MEQKYESFVEQGLLETTHNKATISCCVIGN